MTHSTCTQASTLEEARRAVQAVGYPVCILPIVDGETHGECYLVERSESFSFFYKRAMTDSNCGKVAICRYAVERPPPKWKCHSL